MPQQHGGDSERGRCYASAAPGYLPDTITVVIGVNNTVTWRNDDTVSHTVYSTSVPAGAATFSSPLIAPKGNYSQTFSVAGTYQYHCNIHSWMKGTVIVKSGLITGAASSGWKTAASR